MRRLFLFSFFLSVFLFNSYLFASPVKLKSNFRFNNLTISADSNRVVYGVRDESGHWIEAIYSVPISGGKSVKLAPPELDFSRGVGHYAITLDSRRVVFKAETHPYRYELFIIPITGGKSVKLNPDYHDLEGVNNFKISPDDSRVIYSADQDINNAYELYNVSTNGGTPIKLNTDIASDWDVLRHSISPDGKWVVYLAVQDGGTAYELYSVPIMGGTAVKLNAGTGKGFERYNYTISPDSKYVVYQYDPDPGGPFTDGLYSIPIGGGQKVKFKAEAYTDKNYSYIHSVFDYEISADSSRVVYISGHQNVFLPELYSEPITGGKAVKLNSQLVEGGEVLNFIVSPDNSRVIYRADQETDGAYELYSVPLKDGNPISISSDGLYIRCIRSLKCYSISANSKRVVYLGDKAGNNLYELYSVPITGGSSTKLNRPLVEGGKVLNFIITPDSSRVVYQADQVTTHDFCSVAIAGGKDLKIHSQPGNYYEDDYIISPDSSHYLYLSPLEGNFTDLYSYSFNPLPDIGANKSHTPITINPTDKLSISIDLSSGGFTGDAADWWLLAATPFGWFHYDPVNGSWVSGLTFSHQGPLFNIGTIDVLDMPLPVGTYDFYFGVDMIMNGSLNMGQIYYDSLRVNIQ